MTRRFPAGPILGVGAVIVDGSRVLLVRRAHEPLKGEWSLPGGGVELGETLEAAVIRETGEETGLVVTVGPAIEVLDSIRPAPDGRIEYHFVIVDYLCTRAGTAEAVAGSDVDAVRWAEEADLAQFHLSEKATSVVRQAFAMSRAGATDRR